MVILYIKEAWILPCHDFDSKYSPRLNINHALYKWCMVGNIVFVMLVDA